MSCLWDKPFVIISSKIRKPNHRGMSNMKRNQDIVGTVVLVAVYILCFPLGVIMTLAKSRMQGFVRGN